MLGLLCVVSQQNCKKIGGKKKKNKHQKNNNSVLLTFTASSLIISENRHSLISSINLKHQNSLSVSIVNGHLSVSFRLSLSAGGEKGGRYFSAMSCYSKLVCFHPMFNNYGEAPSLAVFPINLCQTFIIPISLEFHILKFIK